MSNAGSDGLMRTVVRIAATLTVLAAAHKGTAALVFRRLRHSTIGGGL